LSKFHVVSYIGALSKKLCNYYTITLTGEDAKEIVQHKLKLADYVIKSLHYNKFHLAQEVFVHCWEY